jgi:serine/threonine-protein kinase
MASFKRFRTSLIVVAVVVMALGLGAAYLVASRITGPVRTLVALVEKARDGSYSGAVSVGTSDEIGVLARAFNNLLADLREKQQMIEFLREGMTMMKKGVGAATAAGTTDVATAATASIQAVTAQAGVAVEKGALFAGRYEILGTLGKGGMGVVYRARDKQLDEVVALKVLRPDVLKDDPTLLERFKQEIKLARKITHRNVLRTHDFGEADGTPYISMEFIEGVDLKSLIKGKGALPLGVGLRVAKQMCQGLDAAHRQGVVHRDIKPQNMLIMPETGELKIMDFGIARVSEVKGGGASGLTTAGTVMGTPDYMPPEQAQGQTADFRSDLYSLGVVLFEVFTGRLPFGGETPMHVVLNHIQKPPPAPRSANPRIPPELEAVILRCLEKEPSRRYAKVADLLKELTALSARAEAAA